MKKQVTNTAEAPQPIGPYSQAVAVNGMLFISGQIGLDPHTGEFAHPDLKGQAVQVMENLKAILRANGAGFENVIKTSIFLAPGQDFGAVNTVYGTYFSDSFPARETVWVQQLPKNALVEISMIVAL
jgi:2-iminobutanoate/2-iminopropanoate deaminase